MESHCCDDHTEQISPPIIIKQAPAPATIKECNLLIADKEECMAELFL